MMMKKICKQTMLFLTALSLVLSKGVFSHAVTDQGEIVVVLDAGHDIVHAGTTIGGPGYVEAELNLKIAMYCKEKLETYSGVKVYMVRETTSCPFPGTNSTQCNQGRVEFATSVGVDYYVSFHLNSYSDPSVKGAVVFHPNNNYRPDIAKKGVELSKAILAELVGLGLKNGGVRAVTTDSEKYQFPDGSQGDSYRVIREGKKAGHPAIIVEHAFLSSEEDKENYLSTDEKLKALGEADARGIAKYLGLTEGNGNGNGGSNGSEGGNSNNGGENGNSGGNTGGAVKPKPMLPIKEIKPLPSKKPFFKRALWKAPRLHHNVRYYLENIHTKKPICE